jgi:hypothetical protein
MTHTTEEKNEMPKRVLGIGNTGMKASVLGLGFYNQRFRQR